MLEKIKQNLTYTACAVIGFLNFILLAFPYVASFYSYDLGEWGGKQSDSEGISGYKVMDLWDGGFGGVMSSLVQLIILILGIALLVWGIGGFLKAMGILPQFPDKVAGFESKKLGEFGLLGIAALNILLLIFLIILCASNTETYKEYGYESSAGIRLSAGIFISIIFTAGTVVGLKLLEKKLPALAGAETVTYSCAQCGKKAKASDKFCNVCGGSIEKKVVAPTLPEEYVCTACGKKAKAGSKFCNECGGAVEKRTVVPPTAEKYVCSACGKEAKAGSKFCNECGGAVVKQ